jgi:hypothetical protein
MYCRNTVPVYIELKLAIMIKCFIYVMIFLKVKIQLRSHNFDPDQDPTKSSALCKSGSTTLVYQTQPSGFKRKFLTFLLEMRTLNQPTTGPGYNVIYKFLPVLRIRDVYPGSGSDHFCHPGSGSRILHKKER